MGVLGVIEEIQRIPAQTRPQSPGCLSHRNKQINQGIPCCVYNSAVFSHLCNGDFPFFFITPPFPVPRDGQGGSHSCCQSVAMDQCNTLHLSPAHITCLYCIKMSLMTEGGLVVLVGGGDLSHSLSPYVQCTFQQFEFQQNY